MSPIIQQTEDETPPPLRRFLSKLDGVRHEGGNVYKAECPSHDDERQSLQVEWGEKNKVVFTCHAGCERNDIIKRLGVGWKDLEQNYEDEDGELVYQAVRYEPKAFSQRRPDPDHKGKFLYNMRGVDPLPFRLPALAEAVANGDEDTQIWIVEGEKDCLAIIDAWGDEFVTTCNHGGAGKWTDEHSAWLEGHKGSVVIVADNDDKATKPGQKHALAVYESLRRMTDIESVEIVYAPIGKDAADAVRDYGPEDFIAITPEELRRRSPRVPATRRVRAAPRERTVGLLPETLRTLRHAASSSS